MSAASSTPKTVTAIDHRAIFLPVPAFFFGFFGGLGCVGFFGAGRSERSAKFSLFKSGAP